MERRGLSQLGQWPHSFSNALACLACTLGIFNISRFAILSIQFGANFIIQFLVMSVIMGIPLFTFHVALGQLLGTGTMDMWKISPIFQGIGVALILSQALLGIYSIVGVSWMLVYFRDSFITTHDTYRWAEPYLGFIGGPNWRFNSSFRLEETVGDYFSGVVLQRHNVENPSSSPGTLKFQLTFNLAVVWMIVFIALSKGLKSYGKVVFMFSLVPILGMVFLCVKIMGLAPSFRKSSISIPQTDWSEFFLNSKSWSVAMTEAFYTWGLLGASAMQMASHNRPHHLLYKDTNIVTAVTFAVLILSAFLANTCSQLLLAHGYQYTPSSFEKASTYGFLQPVRWSPLGTNGQPVKWMTHNLYLAGDRIVKPGTNTRQQSGYQALRFATELMPATLAVLGAEQLSPFWSVLFYFIFILFGIAQQLAIMHSIITGIMAIKIKTMKSWETTITFFACVCGFILGLPMATEFGIFVVYFLDFCVGGAWWIVLLYLIEIMVVFMVRGRPYSGETVVSELFKKAGTSMRNWAAPLLSFTWNVILPVFLMIQTVNVFKSGNYRDLFRWGTPMHYDYWPPWSRTFGSLLQIIPLLTIPFVAIVQSCRYLSKGPPDILDRIQLLYRPPEETISTQSNDRESANEQTEVEVSNESAPPADGPPEDPPPKYTPPPSYSTATGARIAKMLRQSFRRSFRRLTNARDDAAAGEASNSQAAPETTQRPPPPDYATVLVEINRPPSTSDVQPPDVVPQASAFSHVSTLVRNSFRRAMRNNEQSTSSERLVDTDVNNRAYIIPRLVDTDKPNGNV
ncbi:transporter [Nesidiocoris tenuis]|uniref:Transporter n=1 Tax=Nesidiocoris tenuis TaxID=355587 RepID=A0ABN7B9D9_9HEMI|nr:transporter [Nesidiocoris tenuis]